MTSATQLALFAPERAKTPPKLKAARLRIAAPVRVQHGDLWQLGRHRLLCGDGVDAREMARLFDGVKPSACITDPPYGMAWNADHSRFTDNHHPEHLARYGHLRRKLKAVHGDMQPFDPSPLLAYKRVVLWGMNNYAALLPPGSLLIWNKRLPDGRAFLADGEAAWMKGGRGVYIFDFVWQGYYRGKPKEAHHHPTQKPVPLMEWCIEKAKAGETVYDPYCGSGPVLLACERTGRACYAAEIEPPYCDVILHRWEQETGQQAVLIERASE